MKHYWKGLTITLAALVLAACGTPSSSSQDSSTSALTAITISGANDVSIEFDADFNFLTGVTATGNNGSNYTANLTLSSISTAVNTTTGELDTTKTGVHTVQYRVQSGTVVAAKFRNVTVEQPESTGGMLVNPDFALGTAGWDDPSVVYIADGAAMTLSTETGELKAVVTAGTNIYTPRFGQMNVPFEQGKTYEVSFDARSSVNKQIALQVGELLTAPPYFTDFLPIIENVFYRNITTTMQTYSYQFTMTQNNPRGGILFGLGRVNSVSVNATMYFDNIEIVETTPSVDTSAPIFAGVLPTVNVLVGASYDPLEGVTAVDVVDGDLTDEIVVEIFNSSDAKVNEVDTTAPGVFTVEYTVEDAMGNVAEVSTTVNVVSLTFKNENLLPNGSFATAIGQEWDYWQQPEQWVNPAPIVSRSQDVNAGTYSLDINGGGDAVWAIQFFQDNINLVEGTTYRFSVTATASVARKISVGIGYGEPWNEYGRKNGLEIGTTSSTQDFVFTVTKATANVKVVLELGTQDGFANGVLTLSEVRLQRLEADSLVANGDFSLSGWRGYSEPGVATTTSGIVNGEFKMTISQYAPYPQGWDTGAIASSFHLQIVQDAESLVGIPKVNQYLDLDIGKTYTLTFDAYASEPVTITPNIFGQDIWINHTQSPETVVTTSKQTYTKTVSTVGAALNNTEKLAFEFGKGVNAIAINGTPVSVYLDNVLLKEVNVDVPSLYNGNMETVLGGHTIDGPATLVNTSEGALLTVNEMGLPYVPHYFYTFDSLEKGDYQIKFVLKGDVSRTLRFNVILPDAGYASILPNSFIDFNIVKDQTYVFTTSFKVTTPLTNVKVEVDFGNLGGASNSVVGSFLISELLVYRNYNA
jgi:hypothetical protein